ncbi:hypothetical protein Hte_005113 [Hypoxylon texense]
MSNQNQPPAPWPYPDPQSFHSFFFQFPATLTITPRQQPPPMFAAQLPRGPIPVDYPVSAPARPPMPIPASQSQLSSGPSGYQGTHNRYESSGGESSDAAPAKSVRFAEPKTPVSKPAEGKGKGKATEYPTAGPSQQQRKNTTAAEPRQDSDEDSDLSGVNFDIETEMMVRESLRKLYRSELREILLAVSLAESEVHDEVRRLAKEKILDPKQKTSDYIFKLLLGLQASDLENVIIEICKKKEHWAPFNLHIVAMFCKFMLSRPRADRARHS